MGHQQMISVNVKQAEHILRAHLVFAHHRRSPSCQAIGVYHRLVLRILAFPRTHHRLEFLQEFLGVGLSESRGRSKRHQQDRQCAKGLHRRFRPLKPRTSAWIIASSRILIRFQLWISFKWCRIRYDSTQIRCDSAVVLSPIEPACCSNRRAPLQGWDKTNPPGTLYNQGLKMTSSTAQEKIALAQKDNHRALAAADFGDVPTEFRALVSGSGVYDLGQRAKIIVNGSDRVRWLNGMVTNNVRDLAVGCGVYAFLLNPQGHILADLYAYNRGESLLVDTDQTELEKVLAVFDKYIIMDDVDVANISDQLTAVGIAGPNAAEILSAAGIESPELQPLQFVNLNWRQ